MELIHCNYEQHAAQILDIFNEVLRTSTTIYEYEDRTMEMMAEWFREKHQQDIPVLGLVGAQGALMGFASFGSFRARPAYKYSIEHSIYVRKDQRGRGLGSRLLRAIIELARERQYHTLIGGIDMDNKGSIAFHEKLGFVHAGTIRHAGFKFGRWLDLGFYQLMLETPVQPVDG